MPYEVVARVLAADPEGIVAAGGHYDEGELHLDLTAHVPLLGVEVAADAVVTVGDVEHGSGPIPSLCVPIGWRSPRHPHALPVMEALLEAFPTSERTTELAIAGEYEPPLGTVGVIADHRVMHRVTSEVVEALLEAIAREIKNRRSQYELQGSAGSDT